MIGVYDENIPSGLTGFYLEAKEKGIELYPTSNLNNLNGFDKVIINPKCIVFENHWKEIGEYIKKNSGTKILFFAPDNSLKEIEKFIGTPKNIEYIAIMNGHKIDLKWDKLDSLVMEASK
jgi:hypothetical protein